MNKYRITFIASIFLFVILSVISSIIGTGLFQSFLILTAFILLLGISIGGIAILGHKKFWWDYFKPLTALPIAWGLLHLGFALTFPDSSKEIWAVHWKLLIVIELSVFTLNSITNKDTSFEKRTSQKLLVTSFVLLFIITGTMITYRLFWGESAVNLDKSISYRLIASKVDLIAGNIKELTNDRKTKPMLEELKWLNKEAEKRFLTEAEEKKKEKLITDIKKQYKTPTSSNISFVTSAIAATKSPSITREFGIPAMTEIDRDTSGQKLRFLAGDKIVIEILNEPFEKRKLVFLNQTKISVQIRKRITTLWGRNPGFVEFINTGKEPFFVQVKINS